MLVGAPGAGKTTVGQALARRRGLDFRDTDRDVEQTTGRRISEIFVVDGEAAFRELEQNAVRTALAEHPGVLALGGGAVLADQTRKLLAGHYVVFLDVSVATAAARVGLNQSRPLLAVNPRAELTRLLAARRPLYEQVASVVVRTDDRSVDEVVDAIDAALVGT